MNRVRLFLTKQAELYQIVGFGGNIGIWVTPLFIVALFTSAGAFIYSLGWLPALLSFATLTSLLSIPALRVVRDRNAPWVTVNDLSRTFIFVLFGLRSPLVANPIVGCVIWILLTAQPIGLLIGLLLKYPIKQFGIVKQKGVALLLVYLGLNIYSDAWVLINFPVSVFDFRLRDQRIAFPIELSKVDSDRPKKTYTATAIASFEYMTNTTGAHACITAVKFGDRAGSINFDVGDCCGYLIQPFADSTRAFLSHSDGENCVQNDDGSEEKWDVESKLSAPFLLKLWGIFTLLNPWDPSKDLSD